MFLLLTRYHYWLDNIIYLYPIKKKENHYHVTALLKCSFDITDFYGRFVTVSFPQHCHCRGDLANKEMVIFLCKSNAWYIYIYSLLPYFIVPYIYIYPVGISICLGVLYPFFMIFIPQDRI